MVSFADVVEPFQGMWGDQIEELPPEVWRDVEQTIIAHWPGKVAQATVQSTYDFEPGWLNQTVGQMLIELDVPVHKIFTLCALRLRKEQV